MENNRINYRLILPVIVACIGAMAVIIGAIIQKPAQQPLAGEDIPDPTVNSVTTQHSGSTGSPVQITDSTVSSSADRSSTAVTAINSDVRINADNSKERAVAYLRTAWESDLPATTSLLNAYPASEAGYENLSQLIPQARQELDGLRTSFESLGNTEYSVLYSDAHNAINEIGRISNAALRLLMLIQSAERGGLTYQQYERQAEALREELEPTTKLSDAFRALRLSQHRMRNAIADALSVDDMAPSMSHAQLELQQLFQSIEELGIQGKDQEARDAVDRATVLARKLYISGDDMGREALCTALSFRAIQLEESGSVQGAIADFDEAIDLARTLLIERDEDTNRLRLCAYLAERTGLNLPISGGH